jgi:hypothetical protein
MTLSTDAATERLNGVNLSETLQIARATLQADRPLWASSYRSEQLDQSTLSCSIAFDIPLGCCQRSMPSKLLNIA